MHNDKPMKPMTIPFRKIEVVAIYECFEKYSAVLRVTGDGGFLLTEVNLFSTDDLDLLDNFMAKHKYNSEADDEKEAEKNRTEISGG